MDDGTKSPKALCLHTTLDGATPVGRLEYKEITDDFSVVYGKEIIHMQLTVKEDGFWVLKGQADKKFIGVVDQFETLLVRIGDYRSIGLTYFITVVSSLDDPAVVQRIAEFFWTNGYRDGHDLRRRTHDQ